MASLSVVIFIVQKICRFDATQNGMAHAVTFVAILPPTQFKINKRRKKTETKRNKIKALPLSPSIPFDLFSTHSHFGHQRNSMKFTHSLNF